MMSFEEFEKNCEANGVTVLVIEQAGQHRLVLTYKDDGPFSYMIFCGDSFVANMGDYIEALGEFRRMVREDERNIL